MTANRSGGWPSDEAIARRIRQAFAHEFPDRTLADVLARAHTGHRHQPRPAADPLPGRLWLGGRRALPASCTRTHHRPLVGRTTSRPLLQASCPHRVQVGWLPCAGELIAVLPGRGLAGSRQIRVPGGPGAISALQARLRRHHARMPLLVRLRLWLRMARTYRTQAQLATVRAHRPDPDPTQP